MIKSDLELHKKLIHFTTNKRSDKGFKIISRGNVSCQIFELMN